MISGYKLVVDGEAVHVLLKCDSRSRQQLLRFLDGLSSNPHQKGDYRLQPPNDRNYEVKLIAQFKVTYWADNAVRELRVVDIQRLIR